jgi:serine/threonine protein kinase
VAGDREAPSPGVESLLGETVDGKYRVEALLGQGGMGAVYRATHIGTGRQVALKVLLAQLTAHESAVERFRREARAAGQMRHRNIVDVTDFGFAERGADRLAYLVMELVPGKTLRAVLDAQGKLPLRTAVDVLDQVCAAVTEAHRHGILHRDLKPENILLESAAGGYRVKVLDFGIAKLIEPPTSVRVSEPPPQAPEIQDESLALTMTSGGGPASAQTMNADAHVTRPGAAVGTPLYMSPEQWRGEAADVRTDVYGLGVVAYEMFAGEPPFLGRTGPVRVEHLQVPPPPLLQRAPGLPAPIARVVEAALAKRPQDRPPSAAAFAASLHAGSETTGSLLWRSVTLTVEHFMLLTRACAALTLPQAVGWVAVLTIYLLARGGVASSHASSLVAASVGTASGLWGAVLARPVAGLLVPRVTDLLASRAPSRRATLAELWTTALRALPSTLVLAVGTAVVFSLVAVVILIALGAISYVTLGASVTTRATEALMPVFTRLLGDVSGAFAGWLLSLVGAVAAMERVGGLAPLRRSFVLLRPVWRVAFGVQLFYALLTDGLAWILVQALGGSVAPLPPADANGGVMAAVLGAPNLVQSVLVAPVAILLTPFTLVPFALLYLRAREAEGHPL